MTTDLDLAYEYCRRLTRERAKNFYYAFVTLPAAKRRAIYRRALELINQDLPHLFVGHLPIFQAARTHLKNMKTNCRGDVRWSDGGVTHAWLEK